MGRGGGKGLINFTFQKNTYLNEYCNLTLASAELKQ